jgi:hypothetical protein
MVSLENTLNEDKLNIFDNLKASYKLAGPKVVMKAKYPFKATDHGSRVYKTRLHN